MDKAELQRRIEAGTFAADNGKALRAINILVGNDIKLRSLEYALQGISAAELAESLYYLQDSGYIHVKNIVSKRDVDVANADYDDTEVRLTAKGVQLLKGYIADPAVEM